MKTEEEKEEAKKGTKEKAIPNEDESMVKFRAALSLLYCSGRTRGRPAVLSTISATAPAAPPPLPSSGAETERVMAS